MIALAGYLVVVAAVFAAFASARNWASTTLTSPEATQEWRDWAAEEASRAESPDQPVRRRTPKSPEPPALVLLRDYYATIVGASLLIATFVYAFMAWMLWGVATGSAAPSYTLTDDPPPKPTSHGA